MESSLIKLQVFRTATFLKRDPNSGFFLWICQLSKNTNCEEDLWFWTGSEKPVRLFKTPFLQNIPVAASDSFSFPACNFVKKEARAKMFICEFCKIFKNIFWRNDCFNLQTTASCVYLQFLRSFSDHSFYRTPPGNCLFPLQVVKFQPPHRVKKYFTSSFKSFYTRRYANSYSKAFMHLEPLIIICEEVNL